MRRIRSVRSGMGLGKGKGYSNMIPKDPNVHKDSAKGIKQPENPIIMTPEPIKDISKEEQDLMEIMGNSNFDQIEDEYGEITKFEEEGNHYLLIAGGKEFLIFHSEDKAIEYAEERVREDLENEPEIFTPSWLEGHIDKDHLRDELESDVSDSNLNYYNDIEDESDSEWQNRCVAELIDGGYLNEEDFKTKSGNLAKISDKLQEMIDKAKEEAVEKKTEEDLEDPIEYLEQMYSKEEATKKAIEIGGIDYDKATEEAVSMDGWSHFIATYDGDSIDLKDGWVMARTN